MKKLYDEVCLKCSALTTKSYSTSFSWAIKLLYKKHHDPIYAIYGFVRFADEIVDSFEGYDKETLLNRFEEETYRSIAEGISLNPILNSFQQVVRQYQIEEELIDTFLKSMRMDLHKRAYSQQEYEDYILGSAEVVGLMCLRVFCNGDEAQYQQLKPMAMSLGAAFQKVNFLRDLHADYKQLGRTYFPNVNIEQFDQHTLRDIEEDIAKDFRHALEGIKQLPKEAKFGVYLAYVYYRKLFEKIKQTPAHKLLTKRVRISNPRKLYLIVSARIAYRYVA